MEKRFKVKLSVFRGAGPSPVSGSEMIVESDTALNACCRAEELLNVRVADNEYAAAMAVWPLWEPRRPPLGVMARAA